MITMRFGSDEILGVRLKDDAGEPLDDAEVTYEILDKNGASRTSGTMQRNELQDTEAGAAYEVQVNTNDFVDLSKINYARPKPQNFFARIIANDDDAESLIRLHVHHDTD